LLCDQNQESSSQEWNPKPVDFRYTGADGKEKLHRILPETRSKKLANIETDGGSEVTHEDAVLFAPKFPFSKSLTFKYLLTGVLIPVGCIVSGILGVNSSYDLPWQTGMLRHYAAMFLREQALLPVLPFFAYCLLSMVATLFFRSARKSFWALFGLMLGVLISFVYWVAVIITSQYVTFLAAAIAIAAISLTLFLVEMFVVKFRRFGIAHLMLMITVVAVLLVLFQLTGSSPKLFALIPLGVLLAAGPTLCLITYVRVTISSLREFRRGKRKRSLFDVPLALGGVASLLIAWRLSIDFLLLNYLNLPTTDPNCYVSSAAANGHRNFVGARELESNGRTVLINLQMQRLKFLEFVLMATAPKLHKSIRKAYNLHGPSLAMICSRSKLAASLTFVLLKPIEWSAALVGIVTRIPSEKIRSIYVRSD
jgi:hypothetical protein